MWPIGPKSYSAPDKYPFPFPFPKIARSGPFKVGQAYIGDTPSGAGLGSLCMRLVPEVDAPPTPRP